MSREDRRAAQRKGKKEGPRHIEADPRLTAQHLANMLSGAQASLAESMAVNNMLVAESAEKDERIEALEQQVSDRDVEIMELREKLGLPPTGDNEEQGSSDID